MKTWSRGFAAAFWFAFATLAPQSSAAPQAVPSVGINMDLYADWQSTYVFVDAFKRARPWLPQIPGNADWTWNTFQYLEIDANGWPLPSPGQAAGTTIFKEMDDYPGGVYNLFWDGTGTFAVHDDAVMLSQNSNSAQFLVTPSDLGIRLKVWDVDPNNPVKNVRVIMPGFENTYQQQPFHPKFLERIEPYTELRFMQWQRTNDTFIQHWWERITPDYFSQADEDNGMAIEWMIELANHTGKSPWFCVPHLATDDYVREFARLVATQLDPSIKVYIEYSNEVWNNTFPAFQYAAQQGLAQGLGPDQFYANWRWYSQRSVEIFDIWHQEFQNIGGPAAKDRVIRTLAAQSSNPAVGQTIMDHNQAYQKADALATAPYFGHVHGEPANQWATIGKSEWQIIQELKDELSNEIAPDVIANTQNASNRGLLHTAYEGGQHLVGTGGAQDNQSLTDKFAAVNRDQGMYDVYRQYLDIWRSAGADVMTLYSLCGEYDKLSNFGHIESMSQTLNETPKFRAIVDYAATVSGGGGPGPIQAEIEDFGYPCSGTWASVNGSPTLGSTNFGASLSGGSAWAPNLLTVGFNNTTWLGLTLPVDLSSVGAYGCNVWVGEGISYSLSSDQWGNAYVSLPVPADPAFAGVEVYLQWLATKPGVNPSDLGMTQGIRVKIGT